MEKIKRLLFLITFALASCSGPKSYFTVGVRAKVESKSIVLSKLQFYVDRDVELRRELSSTDAKVTSGKVEFENGKYIHIILLKKYTPGVCTNYYDGKVDISFELGDGKYLTFGVSNGANSETIYQIFAQEWINSENIGKVIYDDKTYYIQPNGVDASLMIKKSVVDKLEIKKRVMTGRKLD